MAKKKGRKKKESRSTNHNKVRAAARNRAHRKEKGEFSELLSQLCRSLKQPQPTDKKDRLPLLEMLFCLIYKVYLRVSYRTLESFLKEMLTLNYITQIPFFNSFGNYMNLESLRRYLERLIEKTGFVLMGKGIHAAIDSTKLFFEGYHEEKIKKGRKKGQKRWVPNYVRLHAVVDTETYLILAARVSAWYEDEKQFFGPMLREACQRAHIISIAGDKNYSSEVNMRIAEELDCTPYLYPKKNYKSDSKKSLTWNNNLKRHWESTEEDAKRIRRRKLIETCFSMIKVRFDGELFSKHPQGKINEALINESLCLVICHNLRALIFNREMYGIELVFPPDERSETTPAKEEAPGSEAAQQGSETNGEGVDDAH